MNKYTIYTIENDFAPARMRWAAAFHPLDEGDSWPTSAGATEHDAIADLVLNHDLPQSDADRLAERIAKLTAPPHNFSAERAESQARQELQLARMVEGAE